MSSPAEDADLPRVVFEALVKDHLVRPGSGRRLLFGRDCLTRDGRTLGFLDGDRLALELPPATAADLLASGEAVVPRMGQRLMPRWVSVALGTGATGGRTRWATLLSSARAYVAEDGHPVPCATTSHEPPRRIDRPWIPPGGPQPRLDPPRRPPRVGHAGPPRGR